MKFQISKKFIFSILAPIIFLSFLGSQESFANESFKVDFDDKEFVINYRIINGTVERMTLDSFLILKLEPYEKGTIFLSYPYAMNSYGHIDDCFSDEFSIIVNDEKEIPYKSEYKNSFQIMKVPFENDHHKLEFVRLYVPEDTQYFLKCLKENIDTMTPSQQQGIGIKPSEIICKPNLELVLKNNAVDSACVNPITAEKLIQRGWAQATKPTPNCVGVDISSITDVNICGFFS